MKGPKGSLSVDAIDISEAAKKKPTANFMAPAKLWNASRTQGTLVVEPTAGGNTKDAWVQHVKGGPNPTRLPQGTLLKQLDVIKGDGRANKPLPAS